MTDEQTKEADTKGDKVDNAVENSKEPVSLYDKTEALVTRQEEANKEGRAILEENKTLYANQRLAGTGKNVDVKPKDPDQEMADKLLADEE